MKLIRFWLGFGSFLATLAFLGGLGGFLLLHWWRLMAVDNPFLMAMGGIWMLLAVAAVGFEIGDRVEGKR